MKIFAFLLIVTLSVELDAYNGRRLESLHKEPHQPIKKSIRVPSLKTISQSVDNFNPQDIRTWEMRYYENDEFYKPGGPLFIFVGGEWEISPGFIVGGHMYDMAKDLHGYQFYPEHRYYGGSHPTTNINTNNLKYLNVDQSLADLAHFIEEMKERIPGAKNSGVIVVGGSYSATMVTWFRQKYPHLANGAWASSAPLFAKLDFVEYKETVTASIRLLGGDACASRIERAIAEMEVMVATGHSEQVMSEFKICANSDFNKQLDVWNFFGAISDTFSGVVQTHSNNQIQRTCASIMDDKYESDVSALAAWFTSGISTCYDTAYSSMVDFYKESEWNSGAALSSGRQWLYQTCAEYGWYQTSGSKDQIFGSSFPVELYLELCKDLYDRVFNETIMETNVLRTNRIYGHMNPEVTNVFFTQGQLDPWRPMGIQGDLNSQSPGTVIPLSSHCSDFGSISPYDSKEMRETKERIFESVKLWLNMK